VSLDEPPGPNSLGITKLLRTFLDNVKDGRNIFFGALLKLVDGQRMSARYGLAIDMLVARSFKTEGGPVVDLRLHDGIFERHRRKLLGNPRWKRVLIIASRERKNRCDVMWRWW
jgi:hypothetical protein